MLERCCRLHARVGATLGVPVPVLERLHVLLGTWREQVILEREVQERCEALQREAETAQRAQEAAPGRDCFEVSAVHRTARGGTASRSMCCHLPLSSFA